VRSLFLYVCISVVEKQVTSSLSNVALFTAARVQGTLSKGIVHGPHGM
jgi:hypothetical protein